MNGIYLANAKSLKSENFLGYLFVPIFTSINSRKRAIEESECRTFLRAQTLGTVNLTETPVLQPCVNRRQVALSTSTR